MRRRKKNLPQPGTSRRMCGSLMRTISTTIRNARSATKSWMDTYDVHHYRPVWRRLAVRVSAARSTALTVTAHWCRMRRSLPANIWWGTARTAACCWRKFGALGEFADYHTFSEGVCTTCGAIDPTYTPPTDPDPTPDPNPGGDDSGGGSGGNPGGDGDGGDDSGSGAGGDPGGGGSDSGDDGSGDTGGEG